MFTKKSWTIWITEISYLHFYYQRKSNKVYETWSFQTFIIVFTSIATFIGKNILSSLQIDIKMKYYWIDIEIKVWYHCPIWTTTHFVNKLIIWIMPLFYNLVECSMGYPLYNLWKYMLHVANPDFHYNALHIRSSSILLIYPVYSNGIHQ